MADGRSSSTSKFLSRSRQLAAQKSTPPKPPPKPKPKKPRKSAAMLEMEANQTKSRRRKKPEVRELSITQNIPPMWKHQTQTHNLLMSQNEVMDTSDPGTGKTRGHLEAFADRRSQGSRGALVVAPKSLLQSAWGNDIDKFRPEMSYICAYANNRAKAFEQDTDFHITNTDAVKWLAKQPAKFFRRYDTLIIDECTSFKHRTSARSKAINKIKKYFKYRTGLTGTPNSNTITDLWHQIFLLDDGQRLGKSFFQFRNSVCFPNQCGPMANHVKWEDKPGVEEAVAGLLAGMTIRHVFEECMDIPPNQQSTMVYEIPPKLRRQYEELKEMCILELQESDNINAVNAATLRNKLLQVASGAVYSAEGEYVVLDPARYEFITDLVEQRKHSVVFFIWRHQRDQLVAQAKKRGIKHAVIDGSTPQRDREQIVGDYQAGLYQAIYLHPKTGAHGLTLTRGTRTIWGSPIYEPDFLKQGKHRIYRGGQTQKTETIMVEAKDTVEQLVYQRLNEKNARMTNLLELLTG